MTTIPLPPNTFRHRTSDPPYVDGLMLYLGENIQLDDKTWIRAIVHDVTSTIVTEYENYTVETIFCKIPTARLGTLKAGQVVEFDGEKHYVPTLQRISKGWSVFTLEVQ